MVFTAHVSIHLFTMSLLFDRFLAVFAHLVSITLILMLCTCFVLRSDSNVCSVAGNYNHICAVQGITNNVILKHCDCIHTCSYMNLL